MPAFEREKCKKCYLCLSVNCPAISKRDDGFVAINESICTGCNVCVNACKFQALEKR